MQLKVKPGKYVVAVSGGVDSMALLDMLRQKLELKLVLAHFDHGIRPDSAEDRRLVQTLAWQYDLPYIYETAQLGPGASEATAREARYTFLRRVMQQTGAQAIITAHHQDDLLETALLNWLRGTGRKGFGALGGQGDVLRPLLSTPKSELLSYAQQRRLPWREDSTNTDERYLRNYIRHRLLARLSPDTRQQLLGHVETVREVNRELDHLITNMLHAQPARGTLDRKWFIGLPHGLATEVLAVWLRQHGVRDFDKKLLARLTAAVKTAAPGKQFDINRAWFLATQKNVVQIMPRALP